MSDYNNIIKKVLAETDVIIDKHAEKDYSKALAVAAGLLHKTAELYASILGNEGAAVMFYHVADKYAVMKSKQKLN